MLRSMLRVKASTGSLYGMDVRTDDGGTMARISTRLDSSRAHVQRFQVQDRCDD